MQNSALKIRPVLSVPTLRDTRLFFLSPSPKIPEIINVPDEANEFIYTRNRSPTSD